jgi:hypothetical protein
VSIYGGLVSSGQIDSGLDCLDFGKAEKLQRREGASIGPASRPISSC